MTTGQAYEIVFKAIAEDTDGSFKTIAANDKAFSLIIAQKEAERRKIEEDKQRLIAERKAEERRLAEEKIRLEAERPFEEVKQRALARYPGKAILKADTRFAAFQDGTVTDTETNLMWAAKDNGSNINWENAKSYCDNYRGGGYSDWRMPTQDELAGLYDPGKSRPGACLTSFEIHVATELIDITCFAPWASETRGFIFSEAATFRFLDGFRYWGPQSVVDRHRALPVRSGR